jgi:hypothetical protein
LVVLAFVGSASALIGGYWDDAWHTDRGRDAFLIAPHIAIYAGIATAGGALTLWGLLAARRVGPRAAFAHPPLALGLVAVAVTLASGPIDNAWHIAFGRDAVIWSPPHMLGIAGSLALAAAMVVELAARPERWARGFGVVAGGLVVAAAGFATVEYDTDVPQFSSLWYLPVLGFAAAIALAMVRSASASRWAATTAAAAYTLFIAIVSGFLWIAGFPPPAMPLLLAPAIALDVGWQRRWRPAPMAGAVAIAIYASYVPVRNWVGNGVEIGASDIAIGLPLTVLACWLVFLVAFGNVSPRRLGLVASAVAILAIPGIAQAHDPGQGDEAGVADVTVALVGERASLTVAMAPGPCRETEPRAMVARRAGIELRAPLTRDGCRLEGSLALTERGRWFVYAEMDRGDRKLETWLPITLGSGPARVHERDRYVYEPPTRSGGAAKAAAGVALYAAMLALLAGAALLIRRHGAGSR